MLLMNIACMRRYTALLIAADLKNVKFSISVTTLHRYETFMPVEFLIAPLVLGVLAISFAVACFISASRSKYQPHLLFALSLLSMAISNALFAGGALAAN